MNNDYIQFLESKIVIAESYGFDKPKNDMIEMLMPHQKDICHWALDGGRRAVFASFGLGKTVMQLQIASAVIQQTNKPFLICMPLGVVGEFKRDAEMLGIKTPVHYITDTEKADIQDNGIYLTNYERVRKGDIDSSLFSGVSFDEASAIRNLKTQTTDYILKHFAAVPYRFVFTATPTPNDFIEILNYADFLGVIDRGHALTRFFQRDSTKAGKLTLYPNKKDEFWKWVSTWAVFLNKPSDLGYNDKGYDLPKMHIHEIEVQNNPDGIIINKDGKPALFKDVTKSLLDTSREKRESVHLRVQKAKELIMQNTDDNYILWHHLEYERTEIEKQFKEFEVKSVYGSQKNEDKERLLIDFSNSEYQILSTKPKIAGSGCNFQHACHNAIFVGIDYKFNDFIQAVHRIYRFKQSKEVNIYIIHTQNEREVLKTLKEKWRKHIELQTEMINIVREYGLNRDKITSDMKRQIFKEERHSTIGPVEVYNQDCTIGMDKVKDDSIGLILTSIPFGDHYEYSDNYNDFGHNHGNDEFFKQMDFLTPKLLKALIPGRVAAIHVKDRIRYSYQNGTCFTTISDFSGQTVRHFEKHGFFLMGKITITTDVVRENNQTYRLTWGEQLKDASKMGVGLPEYVLLFRKAPTEKDNAYADVPILKNKDEYDLARWQLDAHAYWKSNGDRFLKPDELDNSTMKSIYKRWKMYDNHNVYDFVKHVEACNILEDKGKLSRLFMTLPPQSNNEYVWDDVNRMKTLNANQVNRKKEKHICLAEGTLILTKRGYIPIESVIVNEDYTLTHTGKWKKIIAKKLTQKDADIVQLKAQGVPFLRTTPTHKIWSRKHKGYRPSETFIKNDPNWSEAQTMKSHYVNQKLPEIIDSNLTNLECWIIGRWLADGHLDYRGHQFFISVGNYKIKEFENKCSQFIGAINPKGSSTQFGLINLSDTVRDILYKCGNVASNKNLPIELISLNIEKSKNLVQGYLSGDGHIDKNGNWHFSSVSRAMLLGFSIVIQRAYGLISSVYASKKAGIHTIEGRKVNAKQLWVLAVKPKGKHTFGKILNDGAWKKVKSVDNVGKSDVWNISVADDASYTAEGCIVKNCPLQFDIIERLIHRYTNKGEIVLDPFGGLFSTAYKAMELGRKSISFELNPEYYDDGLFYLKAMEHKISVPTLFDLLDDVA